MLQAPRERKAKPQQRNPFFFPLHRSTALLPYIHIIHETDTQKIEKRANSMKAREDRQLAGSRGSHVEKIRLVRQPQKYTRLFVKDAN